MILRFGIAAALVADDSRGDHHLRAVNNAHDAEGFQLAGGLFCYVMDSFNAADGKRIASSNACGVGYGDGLETVIDVRRFAGHCNAYGHWHVVVAGGSLCIDLRYTTTGSSQTVGVVHLVSFKTSDWANVATGVGVVRFVAGE